MRNSRFVQQVKQWNKPIVTTMLLAAGYYRYCRVRLPCNQAVILAYHHVSGPSEGEDKWWAPFQRGVSQERFERHMRFLRRSMTPVSLLDVVAAVRDKKILPPRAVAVTFDDGYLDNFTVAYPILKRYEIPATMFVATGFIETARTFWWDRVYAMLRNTHVSILDMSQLARLRGFNPTTQAAYRLTTRTRRVQAAEEIINVLRSAPNESRAAGLEKLRSMLELKSAAATNSFPMMTWAQLREMSRNGIAIESHTHTHPILGLSEAEVVAEELSTSKQLIEQRLDQAVAGLAYPDGRKGTYNTMTLRIAETQGFSFGCIAEPKKVGPGADPFALGRMPVGNVSFPVFVHNLLRAYGIG